VRIGITGPIGCGKSTVAGWLGELGAVVIDADRVARRLTPPGSALLAAVVDTFGRRVLRGDGTLDRAALGRIVFQDPAQLAQLEAIIHPAVRPRIIELLEAADAAGPNREGSASRASGATGRPLAVVIEAIKLVEGGLAALCDEVWLVTCSSAVQRKRIAARGATAGHAPDAIDAADADARIAAQSDLIERLTPFATRIIDTSGSIVESRSRVEAAFEAALAAPR
jgi:dephospho-CoA kinase